MQPIKVCLVEDIKEVGKAWRHYCTLDDRFEVLASYPDAESAVEFFPPGMQTS